MCIRDRIQRARHFTAVLTDGATDASSIGWGVWSMTAWPLFAQKGCSHTSGCPVINSKETYALYHAAAVLRAAPRGPATGPGPDGRRQPISGTRVHARAGKRPHDTRVVDIAVQSAGSVRLLADTEVDPDGFQTQSQTLTRGHRENRSFVCTPTHSRPCGTS